MHRVRIEKLATLFFSFSFLRRARSSYGVARISDARAPCARVPWPRRSGRPNPSTSISIVHSSSMTGTSTYSEASATTSYDKPKVCDYFFMLYNFPNYNYRTSTAQYSTVLTIKTNTYFALSQNAQRNVRCSSTCDPQCRQRLAPIAQGPICLESVFRVLTCDSHL